MSGTTLPLAPDASRGRSLGKYEVLSRLSTGGMAEIFLASQRGLAGFRKLVVLKQILPDIRGEEEFIRMFLDEAKVTAAFNHPHIAQVFDLDIAEGELFLAMEFVPGATLVEVARACRQANHPIPMGFSLMAVRDTAVALHYAHTFTDPLGHPSPVIHRDVAEKNIMVTYEGVTKLLDFGIAKSLARASRTAVGMVKGTSGYMSPEQIMGDPLDARSDLFSLGVVLHELLTGMRLFYAKQAEAMMNAVLKCEVTPPSRANKQIPPELDAIVLRALSKRREDRYATTLEFARALERAVGPLIWHPEQSSEVMRRLFADRREQTRQLLIAGPAGDVTGETNVAQMLAMGGSAPTAPDVPEPPTVNTTSGPPDSVPRRASGTMPTVKSSGPQSAAQPAPRRATTTALPTTPPPPPPPDPEPPRKAVLRAPPQKKLGTRGAGQEPSRPPPPPPPSETLPSRPPDDETHTARTQPGRPALTSPGPARTPPPPPPAALTSSGSGSTRSPAPSPGPARTPPPPPSRPSGGDDTTLRNDSRPRSGRTMEAPRAQVPAPPPPARSEETAMVRVATLSSDSGPSRRSPAPRRRTQAQLPASFQAPDPNMEVTTKPARSFQESRRSPPVAVVEDNDSHVHTLNGVPAARSRVGLKVLATVLALLAVGTVVVGLGLDGGVVSNRVRPLLGLAPRVTPLPPEQVKKPAPPPKAESAPTQGSLAGKPVAPPADTVVPPAPPTPAPEEAELAEDTAPPVDEEEKSSPRAKSPRTPNKRAQPRDSAPLATGEPGFLTLSTEPQAQVFLGGQPMGETPLSKVNLPSGKHTLKLVDDEGRALKLTVEIKPGETTSMRVPLEMLSRQ
ncbi:protein kinase domain-containing protein [Myxococcus fulvus]|uniref:protein kinase domain-containing protein n=1 Tax=Myxococcus fulvus TaxID=33 RepID=UPI003B9A5A82